MRALVFIVLAFACSGCGLLIDGAYLLSGKTYKTSVEQRRPSGEAETKPEVRFVFDGPRVDVACEDVTRGIDRVWNVDKTYEYQGGYHRAHLLPVLLEGAIGLGLGLGVGIKCQDPASNISCNVLYATIPLGVDFTYSFIRLFTTEPAKVVDKTYGAPGSRPSEVPQQRAMRWCGEETKIYVSSSSDSFEMAVPPNGVLAVEQQQRIIQSLARNQNASIRLGEGQWMPRCAFLRELRPVPSGDCVPQQRQ